MEVIRIKETVDLALDKPLIVALGQFDGLHEAHLVLINKAVALANKNKVKSAVITFEPHPDIILKKQLNSTYLTPLDLKIKVLSSLGIDYLIVIDFTTKIALLEHDQFIKNYLIPLNVQEIVVGFDFRYGYRGRGNVNTIASDANNSIKVHVIDEIKYQNEKMGSSMVRKLLNAGQVEEASSILGRYYEVAGMVVHGNKLGQKIGIPTANIALRDDFADIKDGVYGVLVEINSQKYLGICNLGFNPTFNLQINRRLEVHIIDFNGDLYNQKLIIKFVIRLRDELKFSSILLFQEQIKADKEKVMALMSKLL